MNNIERAAEILSEYDLEPQQSDFAAQALADAGLLMPDLPAPSLPTLADMAPEERQACVGMWCDNLVSTAKEPTPVVLACVQGNLCWVLHTDLHGEQSCFSFDSVAPRFDIPRAWNPDGTPAWGTTNE